jgi:hypothetical protein
LKSPGFFVSAFCLIGIVGVLLTGFVIKSGYSSSANSPPFFLDYCFCILGCAIIGTSYFFFTGLKSYYYASNSIFFFASALCCCWIGCCLIGGGWNDLSSALT